MLKVGGFPEYLPAQQAVVDQVKDIIRDNFVRFGYQHIHTPAVEKNSTLTAKGGDETSKQIFGLYGLAQGSEDTKDYSLHFDLTVPFARYTVDNANDLTFPFKRWQMQPVWRGERQQKGRFKEFVQADIDTIWPGESTRSYLMYDAETIVVLYRTFTEILQKLDINTGLVIKLSNKKVITGLLGAENNMSEIIAWVDKYYKMSREEFETGLSDLCSDETCRNVLALIDRMGEDIGSVRSLSDSETFQLGLDELSSVAEMISKLAVSRGVPVKMSIDAAIVRGLDYYTGTVFETFLDEYQNYGSVCSGGRYEHLTQYLDAKKDYSGVGGSIGVDRFMSWVFENDMVNFANQLEERYLILNFPETIDRILPVSGQLVNQGKIVSIYPEPDKLKKQFSYADKGGYSHVVICGEEELSSGTYKIKNLQSGEEVVRDIQPGLT